MQPTTVLLPAAPTRWSRRAIWCRAALIFGWLAMLVLAVGLGARHSTFGALEGAVQAGKVHSVDVAGESAGRLGSSSDEVRLTWRRGLVR